MTAARKLPAFADDCDFWTILLATRLGVEQAGCWRCGALSDLLARILQLSGINAVVIRGTANGIGHVWVAVGDRVLDPTAGQFGSTVTYEVSA